MNDDDVQQGDVLVFKLQDRIVSEIVTDGGEPLHRKDAADFVLHISRDDLWWFRK
jgi:hypothetical protein